MIYEFLISEIIFYDLFSFELLFENLNFVIIYEEKMTKIWIQSERNIPSDNLNRNDSV